MRLKMNFTILNLKRINVAGILYYEPYKEATGNKPYCIYIHLINGELIKLEYPLKEIQVAKLIELDKLTGVTTK